MCALAYMPSLYLLLCQVHSKAGGKVAALTLCLHTTRLKERVRERDGGRKIKREEKKRKGRGEGKERGGLKIEKAMILS